MKLKPAEFAKCINAFIVGVSAWGITAASDGISTEEWFGLLGVVGVAFTVYLTPNEKPSL